MISTFSSTIRRKEMDAVLTCLVDEKIGPGEMNLKLTQALKEFLNVAGCVAFRNATIALSYALKSLNLEKNSKIMISSLAPSWHFTSVKELGFEPVLLDVSDETGLATSAIIQDVMKCGASVLLFHESMGILPDSEEFSKILELGLFVIEDISQSIGSSISLEKSNETESESASEKKSVKKAGTFGVFSILGLEENDSITGGGGAVLISPEKKNWTVLKNLTDKASKTEILPDINSALAFIQLKEFSRNENARKAIFDVYRTSFNSPSQKNKMFVRGVDCESTIWSFPVVLSGSFNDAKSYTKRKEIEIVQAYLDSVVGYLISNEFEIEIPIRSKSLYLRTVLFPLYPRMNTEVVKKISKVLATLP